MIRCEYVIWRQIAKMDTLKLRFELDGKIIARSLSEMVYIDEAYLWERYYDA